VRPTALVVWEVVLVAFSRNPKVNGPLLTRATRGVIELRSLSPDGWRVWRTMRLAALAESPGAFGSRLADWLGDGDREDRWRGRLSIAGSRNVVAALRGEPSGMASGVPSPPAREARPPREPGAVELISLWVAPSARGHGVGDALIEDIAVWAAGLRSPAVWLSVREDNAPAIALYRRRGFQATGERVPDEDHTGAAVEELVFRRPL
jgi:ribosomal protein S18 acetylase RimI-like enzyme